MYLKGMLRQNKSSQDRSCQDRSSQDRSCQDRSSQDQNLFDLNYCESKFFCQIGKQNNFCPQHFLPSSASTQLNFNFEAEIALFSDNTATLGLGDISKVNISRFLEKKIKLKKID